MKKISLIALFAALVMTANANDIWTGSKHVSWDDGPVQIAAEQFAAAQPGNLIKVHFTGATDGIEFKVMKEGLPHLPGSCKGAWINGDGVYEQFLSADAVEDLAAFGLEIIGANFTCTQVELLDGRTPQEGITVWMGYFWADNWNTMELWPEAFNTIDFSNIEAIRFYSEAGRTNYVLNFKINWEESGHIADKDHEITENVGDGFAQLTLTDEMRTKIANAEQWLIQFYKGDEQEPFNFTEVVLVPKSDIEPEDAFWVGEKHISWADGGLQFPAEKFADVVPGNLLRVHYTGATDGIEFKVMNQFFDHMAGSREAAWINGNGVFEQFLTPNAVDSLKAHGLEIIGANFTCTKIELLDGKKDNLKEGITVWTGYFWADEWSTLELFYNGYTYVDFAKASALRIYSEAGRTNYVINIKETWDEGGHIADKGQMTDGDGYAELLLTEELRNRLANAGHWMIQFNKEDGNPFNVTDIVLVMDEDPHEGILNTSANSAGSQKTFENGQLIIINNGVKYNALGQPVR